MKLNPDCIRGILLTVEEYCNFDTPWEYERDSFESEYLAELSHEEILYHIRQAEQSGLIQGVVYYDCGDSVIICDLTPEGHEFLANIHNESVWKKLSPKHLEPLFPCYLKLQKIPLLHIFLDNREINQQFYRKLRLSFNGRAFNFIMLYPFQLRFIQP